MLDLTFLTVEQIFGDNALDVIKKYGTKCAITDFAILLGGYVSEDEYIDEGNTLKNRTGCWWTKSPCYYSYPGDESFVDSNGELASTYMEIRRVGARPVLLYSSINRFYSNKEKSKSEFNEIEYGEYPQTIVDENYSRELEEEYNNGNLRTTDKKYTTDSVRYNYNIRFIARTHIEYEYNGSKYIRFVSDDNCVRKILSNGEKSKEGKVYWIKVEPIVWYLDEETDIALSKYILFSGVQFKNEINYDGCFEQTDIKQFMDKYFSKEILVNNIDLNKKSNVDELDDIFEEATIRMNQINNKIKVKKKM